MKVLWRDFGKYLWNDRKGILVIVILFSIQLTVSSFQLARYDLEDYCCRHMSDDCEEFFESIGIRTYQVVGYRFENETVGKIDSAHRWLLLDFGLFWVPFESTALAFCWDPSFWKGYERLKISEGYISEGRINEELEWIPWI